MNRSSSRAGSRIHLIPVSNEVPSSQLLDLFPSGEIIACDLPVKDGRLPQEKPWGLTWGRLTNIDHHVDCARMRRMVSSANLALLRVEAEGVAPDSAHIVINHTDCDSVLSSALIVGDIPPLPVFGEAAIAADHTGAANDIADLLQGLDAKRNYNLSLRNLHLLLNGEKLEPEADVAFNQRRSNREQAAQWVGQGAFSQQEGVFFAYLPGALDGEFFPALLPDAKVIVVFSPHPADAASRFVKVRLGLTAPDGSSLHDLHIGDFDAGYGGRWNAGSNKRGGTGTPLSPQAYAAHIAARMKTAG